MRSLMRSQLRLGARGAASRSALLARRCCRCSSALVPAARRRRTCSGVPLPWLLLGVARLPGAGRARLVLRAAGRAQRGRLRRPGRAAGEPAVSDARRRPASSPSSLVSSRPSASAPSGCASRARRATSTSPRGRSARAGTPRRSAASTSPPRRSSASPGWCSPAAPTCCGTRSAGPPATWCCWSSSPRRCAGRAPTRCPTSPSCGSSRARPRALASVLVVAIGWLYLVPQFQGAGLTLRTLTGARRGSAVAGRRARRGRSTSPPAACAASPSCRRSSTGSS